MEEWLHLVTKDVVIIDAMALIVVAIGTAEAFFTVLRAAFPAQAAYRRFGEILIRYGRWLVAGLTFRRRTHCRRHLHGRTHDLPLWRAYRAGAH
jgi:hypothetical protein